MGFVMKYIYIFLVAALVGCSSSSHRNNMSSKIFDNIPAEVQTNLKAFSQEELAKVANSGLEKLPLEDLYRLNQLKLKMVRSSLENCKSLMTSSPFTNNQIFKVLDDQEYEAFAKINAKAFILGMNKEIKGTPRPSKSANDKALEIVYTAPNSIFMKYNPNIKLQEDCWALEKIMSYTDEKRNTAAETLLRYLSAF